MTDIVTEVAKAIEKADTDIHVSYQDLARAAIQAYEAALINATMNTATGIKIMEDQERER